MKSKSLLLLAAALCSLFTAVNPLFAQGTVFTYQGFLTENGSASNGSNDLTFTLYDGANGGSAVGVSNVFNDLVITNGLFTVALDFGASAFNGNNRWLQIAARPASSAGAYTNLTPRQPITAAPYAITAGTVSGLVSASQITGTINPAHLASNSVESAQLDDIIALGDTDVLGQLDVYSTAAGTPSIRLIGSSSQISTFGSDGLEQIRLWGASWGELLLFDSRPSNGRAVMLSANSASGGLLSLNDTNGSVRAFLHGANTGGRLALNNPAGLQTVELRGDTNSWLTGRLGLGLINPQFPLHIGNSLGVGPINFSTQRAVVENATTNGRAALLLLAGPAASGVASNRVEVQVEASDSERRGIIGTASDHEVQFRQNNLVRMTLSTNGNLGIGTPSPVTTLHVLGGSDTEISIASGDPNGRRWSLQSSRDSNGNRFEIIDRTANQSHFTIRTNGNVGIGTDSPTNKLHVMGGVSATVFVTTSDRNAKENFSVVDPRAMLEKVAALPITQWNFKEDKGTPHIGPMAQDFYAAFKVGPGSSGIATVDADGVALAAIQGLNQKIESALKAKDGKIEALEKRLVDLETLISKMAGK